MQSFASVSDTKVFFILLVFGMEHLPSEFVKLKLLLLQFPAAFLAAHSVKAPQVLRVPSNEKKDQDELNYFEKGYLERVLQAIKGRTGLFCPGSQFCNFLRVFSL